VTSWGEFIFYGSALETVTFREGLQMIGENAFRGADQLKTVNLPSTLTEIKDRAFYVTEDLEEITLPASLKKMGEFIFYGSGLKKVTIAEGATTIHAGAFRACDKLEEVHLPGTITEIQDRAFYACDSLESVVLPASLKKMGDYVFYGSALETIYFCGSQSDWNGIKIRNNSEISNAQIVFDYVPVDGENSAIISTTDSEVPDNPVEATAEPLPISSEEPTATPEPTATVEPAPTETPTTVADEWICPSCNNHATGKFCNNCGSPRPSEESDSNNEASAGKQAEKIEVPFYSGLYIVGKNINPGSYKINIGKNAQGVIYDLYPSMDDFQNETNRLNRQRVVYGAEGAGINVLLEDGMVLGLNVVNGSVTATFVSSAEEQTLTSNEVFYSGVYTVGKNIDAGNYIIIIDDKAQGVIYDFYPSEEAYSNKKGRMNDQRVIYGAKGAGISLPLEDGMVLALDVVNGSVTITNETPAWMK